MDLENASPQQVTDDTQSKNNSSQKITEAAEKLHRASWLRPAILGVNDGLVTTATLMMGVGAVQTNVSLMLVTGVAGLVAGACSMAIGEFVSVSSQRDVQQTQLKELMKQLDEPGMVGGKSNSSTIHKRKLERLTQVYLNKGLSTPVAVQVAAELAEKEDAVMVQEQLGLDEDDLANPWEAAGASALAFSVGATIPLLSAIFIRKEAWRLGVLGGTSTLAFAGFGALGAFLGGSPMVRSAIRVVVGGWTAMGLTYGVLKLITLNGNKHVTDDF